MLISTTRLRRIQQALTAWYQANSRDLPWRHTRDPYKILVSEIMLQQTQVDRVIPKYRAFLERFPTVIALASSPAGDVIRAWAGLGYNRRALNLQRAAQVVVSELGGKFPDTVEEMRRLPGIGPYTAGAVVCFAFEHDVAFIDTNIRRVIGRVFAAPETDESRPNDRALLQRAEAALPAGQGYVWNQAVMELGALVCTAARPRCTICPIRAECGAYAEWIKADSEVFELPRQQAHVRSSVAERPAPYLASNRYYRGRIVAALRDLEPGRTLQLDDIGPRIRADWSPEHAPWLAETAGVLAAEGLIVLEQARDGTISARLP